VVRLDRGRVILVIDVLPQEGQAYTTQDDTCWFRLSASNYRMTLKRKLDATELEAKVDTLNAQLAMSKQKVGEVNNRLANAERQRDFAYEQVKKLQGEFKAYVEATKGIEEKFVGLTSALEKEILARKNDAEQELAAARPWWRCW
jgi:uncharacterized coiled-coil protein SlyX